MKLTFSDISYWFGYCPRKRKSQIDLNQDNLKITTTGEFIMDGKKDELGIFIPMTFTKRMILYIILDLFLINLIVLYWHEKLLLPLVLGISLIEVIALVVAFAFWVPQYQRAGAQVKW